MSGAGKAYIAGAFEHPTRFAPDKTVGQLHAECIKGALDDAGLTKDDVDGFMCTGEAPMPLALVDYLNIKPRFLDTTETGGASYVMHVAHAVDAIASGRCNVVVISLAGRPRSEGRRVGTALRGGNVGVPWMQFQYPYRPTLIGTFALSAARHFHEYGTTSEQLASIKVAASHHAKYNPNAFLKREITVEEVLDSPMISSPLHRMDCCVITDGGGAVVVTRPEIARGLARPLVKIRGYGEFIRGRDGGKIDLRYSGAQESGKDAFEMAGVKPSDIKYASIYDCFTIAVLMQIEDLGFCEKGQGGKFVQDGNLISGVGKLPFNTDGGGLCSNHPDNRGGMTKIIEAVRQSRGEAHPALQVPDPSIVLAQGLGGGALSTPHAAATLILERE